MLKEIGSLLIDIVSQHQTLQLFDQRVQFQLLDAYAGTLLMSNEYQDLFNQYKLNEKQLNVLKERIEQAAREESYLKYLIDEIEDLQLQSNEEEYLEIEIAKLSNAEQIQQLCAEGSSIIENSN